MSCDRDQIPVRAVRGLISWLAWSRYVRCYDKETLNSQQTQYIPEILIDNDNLMDVDEDFDEDTDESSSELVDNDPYINDTEYDDDN